MSATILPFAPARDPSLDPIMALVASGMNSVNAVILDRMQSRIPLIRGDAALQARRHGRVHPHRHIAPR
jgi:hypothetical protein